jgi:hypothetical protein
MNQIEWFMQRLRLTDDRTCGWDCAEWEKNSYGLVLNKKCSKLHGICENCNNSDHIKNMLVEKVNYTDSDNKYLDEKKWLCQRCQANDTNYQLCECPSEKDYFKRITIHIDLFNYILENKKLVRKDVMLLNATQALAHIFINDLNKVNNDEITCNEILLRSKCYQLLIIL